MVEELEKGFLNFGNFLSPTFEYLPKNSLSLLVKKKDIGTNEKQNLLKVYIISILIYDTSSNINR